jgi:hypothetical protein
VLARGVPNALNASCAFVCARLFRPREGGHVRKIIQWTLVPVAVAAVACKGAPRTARSSMTDEMKRDLQLASATQNLHISPDEIAPQSHQELALKPKKAPGPKVIRDEHPTIKASAKPVDAAPIKAEIPQVQVMASAPAPSETPTSDAPPLARPSPVPQASYPGAQPIPSNGGSGGILGGIWGAVIRGGGMGDDDHCDPRGAPQRPRGGRPVGGDIYGPMSGVIGRPGIPTRGRPRF